MLTSDIHILASTTEGNLKKAFTQVFYETKMAGYYAVEDEALKKRVTELLKEYDFVEELEEERQIALESYMTVSDPLFVM